MASITLDLRPDLETQLRESAKRAGLEPAAYVLRLLELDTGCSNTELAGGGQNNHDQGDYGVEYSDELTKEDMREFSAHSLRSAWVSFGGELLTTGW